MLRLKLSDGDRVLVCARVDEAEHIVRGSVVVQCAECGVDCWRAPGPPIATMDPVNRVIHLRSPLGLPLVQPITVLLCWNCAEAHMAAGS